MRDCYAGNFLSDGEILEQPSVNRDKYNIEDICKTVDRLDRYNPETYSYKEREAYMEISSTTFKYHFDPRNSHHVGNGQKTIFYPPLRKKRRAHSFEKDSLQRRL